MMSRIRIALLVIALLGGTWTAGEAAWLTTIMVDSGDRPCDGVVRSYPWTSGFGQTVYVHRAVTWLGLGGITDAQGDLHLTLWAPGGRGPMAFVAQAQYAPPTASTQIPWDYGRDAVVIAPGQTVTLQYLCRSFSSVPLVARGFAVLWVYDTP